MGEEPLAMTRIAAATFAAAALAACRASLPPRVPCSADGECPSGFHCESGVCVAGERGPALAFASPAEGAHLRGALAVAVQAQDPDGVAEVRLSAGTAEPFATFTAAPYESVLDTLALSDGPLTLHADAVDGRGTSAAATLEVVVDNTPPTLDAFSVAPPTARWDQDVRVQFTPSEAVGAASVTVAGKAATLLAAVQGTYKFTYRIHGDEVAEGNGKYAVVAQAQDLAGNAAEASGDFFIDWSCEYGGVGPGTGDCDDDRTTGCETTLGTLADCSECDDACVAPHGTPTCGCRDPVPLEQCHRFGCAVAGCDQGWGNCSGEPGCETPLGTDANCAACGNDCATALPHAAGTCISGKCEVTECVAQPGFPVLYGDCDGAQPGCETLVTTNEHCGACETPCLVEHREAQCSAAGVCQLLTCSPDWGDCIDDNGECETRLDTSEHCGACDRPCSTPQNADSVFCLSGECRFTCADGYHECGVEGMTFYGCALDSDTAHCGLGPMCGACSAPPNAAATCTNHQCGYDCHDGYHRCGPECYRDDDVAHCGEACLSCPDPVGGNGFRACLAGGCDIVCNVGYTRCADACCAARPRRIVEYYSDNVGNKYGWGIATFGNDAYVAADTGLNGWDLLVQRFPLPITAESAPDWSRQAPATGAEEDHARAIAVTADAIYVAGSTLTLATDNIGTKDPKGLLSKFSPNGLPLWDRSPNLYPVYEAMETFGALAVNPDGNILVGGSAQQNLGNSTAVVATYTDSGDLANWFPLTTEAAGRSGGINAIAAVGGTSPDFIAVGYTNETGSVRPLLARRSGTVQWKTVHTPTPASAFSVASAVAVDAANDVFYVAGVQNPGPSGASDVQLLKARLGNGFVLWEKYWGGSGDESGNGIAFDGTRVLVVGQTTSYGAGGQDGFLLEVDPADGHVLSQDVWGGVGEDAMQGVAVAGSDIYAVGRTDAKIALFRYQIVAGIAPYNFDGNTPILDHFDGATLGTLGGYRDMTPGDNNCTLEPAATGQANYVTSQSGLDRALELAPPVGLPLGTAATTLSYAGEPLNIATGTVEFWVKPSRWNVSLLQQRKQFDSCGDLTFQLDIDANGILRESGRSFPELTSGTTTVPTGQWTHVAVSWSNGVGSKLYVNGQLRGTSSGVFSFGPGSSPTAKAIFRLGTEAGGLTAIDELRISNVQRTTFNLP